MIKALNERSYAYLLKENLNKAEGALKTAIRIQSSMNDPDALAGLYGNLASIYKAQSKFVETIQYYNYSLNIFQDIKNQEKEAAILSNLGLTFYELKNHPVALHYYEEALHIYESNGLQEKAAHLSLGIAEIDYDEGNYIKSIALIEKVLPIFEKNNDLYFSTDCYTSLSKSYLKINNINKALTFANKSLEMSQTIRSHLRLIQSTIVLAELYLQAHENRKALEISKKVLPFTDSIFDKRAKADLYHVLYRSYRQNNDLEQSQKMYDKYVLYNDSILRDLNNLEIVKETVNQEFKLELSKIQQSYETSEKSLKKKQFALLGGLVSFFLILLFFISHSYRKKMRFNKKLREDLLHEIARLKSSDPQKIVVDASELQLNRDKIETAIDRKLNETDWIVLNILLSEPELSNADIAAKAFRSVDGIGSSLRRMYVYFDIKESKYKKISLIMKSIQLSK